MVIDVGVDMSRDITNVFHILVIDIIRNRTSLYIIQSSRHGYFTFLTPNLTISTYLGLTL